MKTATYIDEKQVAEITGLSLSTLRRDRHMRQGMPYYKIGRAVRYSVEDIVEYMESRRIVSRRES